MVKKGFVRIKIDGLNIDRLIEKFKKHKILLLNLKKTGQKTIYLTVRAQQLQKVFAITNNLCYNTTIVGRYGLTGLVSLLKRSVGFILGAILFTIVAVSISSYVLKIEVKGDATSKSVFIKKYLFNNGVTPFTRFSDIDLQGLQSDMLKDNAFLSFVSLKRQGARLIVTAYLNKNDGKSDMSTSNVLQTTVDGVVTYLKAYSGAPLVSVGDTVVKGQVLVDGSIPNGDGFNQVGVYAFAKIKTQKTFTYFLEDEFSTNTAEAFAILESACADNEVQVTYVKENEACYKYQVTVFYTVTVFSG